MDPNLNTVIVQSSDSKEISVEEIQRLLDIEDEEYEEPEYASWIIKGNNFSPAPDIKITKKLPSGVYKIAWQDNDWNIIPIPLNTDELYSFSENFTTTVLKETEDFWNKKELYEKYKLTYKRGILLCGAPGTGKTSLISLLIEQLIEKEGIVFLASDTREFDAIYTTMKPIIRRIEPNRPIITIIEDIDQLITDMRGDAKLLDFLDGQNAIDNHMIILTSNDTTELSEALLRPSRIDLVYEIDMPDEIIRKEYFQKKGVTEEDLDNFVKETEDMSFAELKEVFIGTYVMQKPLDKVIQQIKTPFEYKDYLNKGVELKGLI